MSEPITVIGSNTVINGNLEGDEDLTIEGRVEGTITLSRTLTIERNGVVHANINVRNAIISGVLVGNVEAEDSVHIAEGGRVMGDISAPRVILVDGASFRGSIDMGEFDVERSERSAAPASRATGSATSKAASPSAARKPEPKPAPAIDDRTRVRPVSAAAAASRPIAQSAPEMPKPTVVVEPVTTAKKEPPEPKVRAVGKTKAIRKKRP